MFLTIYQKRDFSILTGDEEHIIIYPEQNSIEIDGNNLQLIGKVFNKNSKIKEKIKMNYYFKNEFEKEVWSEKDFDSLFLVKGELVKPKDNSNFHQFNYKEYLARKKIYWISNADTIKDIKNIEYKKNLIEYFNQKRFELFRFLDSNLDFTIAGYIKALFFADKTDISNEALNNYRMIGLLHLFSISGFHITYLTNIFKRIFLRCNVTHEVSDYLLIGLLPIYGLLTGFGVSVFRAVFQTILVLLSKCIKKPISSNDSWSITMLIALFINPYQVYDISFQLSYAISGILILLTNQQWIQEQSIFKLTVLFSTVSNLISLPILIYHFFEISWLSLISNILFMPFFSYIFFPLLLFLLISSLFFIDTSLFKLVSNFILILIEQTERVFSYLTSNINMSWIIGRLPSIIMIILTINIIVLIKKIERRKSIPFWVLPILLVSLFYYKISPIGYVLMLDVGQGDSFVLKKPNSNKVTLIDTGGKTVWSTRENWEIKENNFSIGENIVVPSLKSLGISKIDNLFVSHAHEDHMGEMKRINDHIPIKNVIGNKETIEADNSVFQLNRMPGTKTTLIQQPSKMNTPTDYSYVLFPNKKYENKNDQSLILYVKIGDDYWLFTGDMEEQAEKDFIKLYPSLNIDYLKVAHHGSDTSSTEEFISKLKPKNAFISVGEKNNYGHPAKEIMKRFNKYNTKIKKTSDDGAVIVKYFKIPLINKWITTEKSVH